MVRIICLLALLSTTACTTLNINMSGQGCSVPTVEVPEDLEKELKWIPPR